MAWLDSAKMGFLATTPHRLIVCNLFSLFAPKRCVRVVRSSRLIHWFWLLFVLQSFPSSFAIALYIFLRWCLPLAWKCRVCKFRLLDSHARHQRHIFLCLNLQRNDLSHIHRCCRSLLMPVIKKKITVVSTNCLVCCDGDVTLQCANYTRLFQFLLLLLCLSLKISVFHSSEKLCLIFIGAAAWETNIVDTVVRVKNLRRQIDIKRHFPPTDWIRANGGIIHLIIKKKKKRIPNKCIRWTH